MKLFTLVVGLGIMVSAPGCASEEDSSSSAQRVTASERLSAAYNTSDFDNVWRLEGAVGFFENTTSLVLVNASNSKKPIVRKNVSGGADISPFSVDVVLGDATDSAALPAPGDCIAVKSDLGGRVLTDDDIRGMREFGAFAYISDPMSGAPKRPAWGVGEGGRPKVYATVAECLQDPDRSWSNANPGDVLTSVEDISDYGAHLQLSGSIWDFEAMADIALVNVSHVTEPLVLEKGFQSGGSADKAGTLGVVVDIPETVKPGDCLAIKNVSSGRGFSDDEMRAKDEFGAFLYAFSGGDGNEHPAGTHGPKVFRTSAECLADPAANRNE
jgi:hypothetical protein